MPSKKTTKKAATPKKKTIYFNRSKKQAPAKKTSIWDIAQQDLTYNQSVISIVLGVLIIVVLGFAIFNFLGRQSGNLIPAIHTTNLKTASQNHPADVDKDHLPGPYTVKAGDTLFLIAQKYYGDGYQYEELAKANNIADVNSLEVGQVLTIPKTPNSIAAAPSAPPSSEALSQGNAQYVSGGTGGSEDETEWGPKITGTTYTVQEGDWLSKIAGRAYGDIYKYQMLAQVNNIQNPDLIEPGTVLQIPR